MPDIDINEIIKVSNISDSKVIIRLAALAALLVIGKIAMAALEKELANIGN